MQTSKEIILLNRNLCSLAIPMAGQRLGCSHSCAPGTSPSEIRVGSANSRGPPEALKPPNSRQPPISLSARPPHTPPLPQLHCTSIVSLLQNAHVPNSKQKVIDERPDRPSLASPRQPPPSLRLLPPTSASAIRIRPTSSASVGYNPSKHLCLTTHFLFTSIRSILPRSSAWSPPGSEPS
jgi:hypothetical protein